MKKMKLLVNQKEKRWDNKN